MIFGSNLLCRLTVIILLLRLVYSSNIPENINQIFSKSNYFRKMSSRIINGTKARPGQFPYQVSLRLVGDDIEIPFCGGAILNSWWVLTAGHCVFILHQMPSLREFLRIFAGETRLIPLKRAKHVRQGIRLLYHSRFDGEIENIHYDIGVIKVNKRWNFSTAYVKPIKHLYYSLPANSSCTISGWGVEVRGSDKASPYLQYSKEYYYDNDLCNARIKLIMKDYDFLYSPRTLCAGNFDNISGPCTGDFGGPLVCDGHLAGVAIAVMNDKCGGHGLPNVYINVRFYWPWIEERFKRWKISNNRRLNSPARTSKTNTLHIASNTFCMVNLIFILYCVVVYV